MEDLNALFAQRMQGSQSSIVRELLEFSKMPNVISLAGGIPASDMFDMEGINEALANATQEGVSAYQYSVTDGEVELRDEVIKLVRDRGIDAEASEVVITSGSQQGLDLISRVFLNEEDAIAVEKPTYLAALQVFKMCGAEIVNIDGDENGLNLDALEEKLTTKKIKALYVVPTFANPTGSTIGKSDRQRLVDLSIKHNFVIFEDDPYGELRFTDRREPSIYELSTKTEGGKGHVIYLTSFSKILVPGLRLGAIIAPKLAREKIVIAKQSVDLHTPVLSQKIVEKYLKSGRLKNRIPLISKTYQNRCELLMDSLKKHVGNKISFTPPTGGMFLWARLANDMDAAKLLKIAIHEGVVFVPGEAFYASDADKSTLRLSFATITEKDAEEAAIRLAKAMANY